MKLPSERLPKPDDMPRALSLELKEMAGLFAGHRGGPVTLHEEAVEAFSNRLQAAREQARALEAMLSAATWNNRARCDRAVELAGQEGSNVVLFRRQSEAKGGGDAA